MAFIVVLFSACSHDPNIPRFHSAQQLFEQHKYQEAHAILKDICLEAPDNSEYHDLFKLVNLKLSDNSSVKQAGSFKTAPSSAPLILQESTSLANETPTSRNDQSSRSVQGKAYVLAIGINNYQHINRLQTAAGDAQSVAQILKDLYGFIPQLVLNEKATHDGILKAMNSLRANLKPEDKLIIYYAGHGILDKETDASYWLPVDAEPQDDTNWIDTKRISDELKRISARQVLLIADSCYAGTMTRAVESGLTSGNTRTAFLRKMREKPSRILIASGGNEPVSDSGGKGHSVFTDVFLHALRNPERTEFTATELFTGHIREVVAGRAEQTPESKVIRNSGHESGDFVFDKLR